jgi:hypothetical protein
MKGFEKRQQASGKGFPLKEESCKGTANSKAQKKTGPKARFQERY